MNRAGLLPRRKTAGRQPDQDPLDPALVRLALVLMLGSFAAGLDTTIVNVAIDSLRSDFHAAVGTIQWVSTAYLLALTMIVPLTAWAVDRFGARRMWLTSLTVFLAGSMLCGMAWSTGSLIGFRVLQGLGGGMLLPLVRTILARAAGKERMGRAMVFVAVPGSLTPFWVPCSAAWSSTRSTGAGPSTSTPPCASSRWPCPGACCPGITSTLPPSVWTGWV